MRLLFDTMPLAGALKAAQLHDNNDEASLTTLQDHLTYFATSERNELKKKNPGLSQEEKEKDRHHQPIWSFDATSNVFSVQNLSVRGEQESYKDCLVLKNLEFGADFGRGFQNAVEIDLPLRGKRKLALAEDALIASFLARGGRAVKGDGSYWPINAWHEFGVMHAFLYDIDLISGDMTPGTKIVDPELAVFKSQLQRIRKGASSDHGAKVESLFVDNAWRILADPETIVAQVAMDVVPNLWGDKKTISVAPHRILICTSVTMHHSHDDFTPAFRIFQAAWGARLYGVIMVNSTHPTGEVVAGVRHVRPNVTTIDGEPNAPCHCSEMNKEIGSLLISDANGDDAHQTPQSKTLGPPWPSWNNIFAYYLTNPSSHLAGRRVQVVARGVERRVKAHAVTRLDDEDGVLLLERQGAFDNIHIAPTMRMPDIAHVRIFLSRAPLGTELTAPVPSSDRPEWRFDDVVMAPVCAHDCFHLHWRWSDNVGSTDQPAMGWSGGRPYQKPGSPLVPENQNVFVKLPDARSLDYWAESGPTNSAGEWQIVNHHGADYVLSTTGAVTSGRLAQDFDVNLFSWDAPFVVFVGREPTQVFPASVFWSVFYWRNRFWVDLERLDDSNPGDGLIAVQDGPLPFQSSNRYQVRVRERVEINDLRQILALQSTYGRPK